MGRENWTELVEQGLDRHWAAVVAARRHLHANPELSFEEIGTTRYLAGVLETAGVEVSLGPLETGLVADVGREGRTLGLRADIDALNVQEATGLPFSSGFPGRMHACGHDAHSAILLGTALVLRDLQEWLPGRVRFIFQPAEEANPSGGRKMVESGFLDAEPRMEELYALHLQPSFPAGTVGVKAGPMMASSDGINLRVKGSAGHAATPQEAVDAIALSAQVINALQYLLTRRMDPTEPVVLSFGTIQGGTRHSVIAEEVAIRGTLRCVSGAARERVLSLIGVTCQSMASGFGGEVEVEVLPAQPVTRNDASCAARVEQAAVTALGPEALVRLDRPWMTAEDFSRFAERMPAAIFWLGSGTGDRPAPLHSPRLDFPEEVMGAGIRVFLRLVADFFSIE